MVYLVDNPPRIRQYRSPRRARPSGVVVVHTAESFPDETGPDTGAENVAQFIRNRSNHGSYHDLVDSDSIIQLVRYSDEAFHDGTGSNPHSYGVSAATQAAKWNSVSRGWREATVTNMARATARYATWLRTNYGIAIPARRITRAQSEQRVPGFISHGERDPARRTDPGRDFPWQLYLDTYARLMAGTDVEDDMPAPKDWDAADRVALREAVHGEDRFTGNRLVKHSDKNVDWHWRRLVARQEANTALLATIVGRDPSTSLTADDVKRAVSEAIEEGLVKVEVSIEGQGN